MKTCDLGLQEYLSTLHSMQAFTAQRNANTPDEIWLLEHLPVLTQGQNGKAEHILKSNNIPLVQSDRGGQVTYHGPGQLIAYTLFDLRRLNLNVRQCVILLEETVINVLSEYNIPAHRRPQAPGVYVQGAKICSIGLRVRRGCSYHGLALNVNMDLTPFQYINPCGFRDLEMTQLSHGMPNITTEEVKSKLTLHFTAQLSDISSDL